MKTSTKDAIASIVTIISILMTGAILGYWARMVTMNDKDQIKTLEAKQIWIDYCQEQLFLLREKK